MKNPALILVTELSHMDAREQVEVCSFDPLLLCSLNPST